VKFPRIHLATLSLLASLAAISLLSGCGHSRHAQANAPPPPPPEAPAAPASHPKGEAKGDHLPSTEADLAEPTIPANARPIETETGRASWYGPPYHNRVGSNGEVYNMHAMTAAHRTLPLGAVVRVTNLNTGHTALVRITDRGPFIPGRILDLSLAAARKLDVYVPGTAEVRVEVMQTPVPIDHGGKWAVQIGGFKHERQARQLADHLTRRYRTAKVQSFASPAGDWWVRIRVLDDDRDRAQKLTAETQTPEGAVFLVRLD
jgi:rare lipoprotein A